jgi:hypothetical protein
MLSRPHMHIRRIGDPLFYYQDLTFERAKDPHQNWRCYQLNGRCGAGLGRTRGAISRTKGARNDVVDLYKGAEARNVFGYAVYELDSWTASALASKRA